MATLAQVTLAALLIPIGVALVRSMLPVDPPPANGMRSGLLVREPNGEVILLNGRRIPLLPERQGWLTSDSGEEGGHVRIRGWAVDRTSRTTVNAILVFVEDKLVDAVVPQMDWPEVQVGVTLIGSTKAGFDFVLPRDAILPHPNSSIRVFALTNGSSAGELYYPDGHPLQTK